MNERLGIEEVGVDLELCVHDHGNDVDPIIETSHINNHSICGLNLVLVILSFEIMVPTMLSYLDFILRRVKVLVLFRSTHWSKP